MICAGLRFDPATAALIAFRLSFALAPAAMQMVSVSAAMMLKILLVLLPMVLIGTTLLTLISASVKSVKEAQSYMSVLMLLPMSQTPPALLLNTSAPSPIDTAPRMRALLLMVSPALPPATAKA